MTFVADFHVHSKYSRATSKKLDLENLYVAACLKGISVVGTGDFTHPGWFSEIREKLVPAEEGLFRLHDDIVKECNTEIPDICKREVRFILVSEISNIYKKNSKTRKNHNLVFVPDLATADRFNSKLDKIGNIKSDGRPILGLDARNLLEILLETSDENFLIPAHIWTPWFSLLGSKSGFDSMEECFEDLTPNIFAVETGLSSDPEMNWRVSNLDNLTLVSNSDAHSPMNLGREANLFDTELSYSAMKDAMKTGDENEFLGTVEFYPEQGKYHLDGHRKCKLCLHPKETSTRDGICPICGKPLTLGVLYRVEELADRFGGEGPGKKHPFYSTIPLKEILSEILRVGPGSKKVAQNYRMLIEKLGPEIDILLTLNPERIDKTGVPLLREAVLRMRQKKISIFPGYDGEYGKIKIFSDEEREALIAQKRLFQMPLSKDAQKSGLKKIDPDPGKNISDTRNRLSQRSIEQQKISTDPKRPVLTEALNENQLRAVRHPKGPMLIVAGPGTGKTRTITHRIGRLIRSEGVDPKHILAVTFTNKAAGEMKQRLIGLVDDPEKLPLVTTFHSFCYRVLQKHNNKITTSRIIDDDERRLLVSEALKRTENTGDKIGMEFSDAVEAVIKAKQLALAPGDDLSCVVDAQETGGFSKIFQEYQKLLFIQHLLDFEDIILLVIQLFENDPGLRKFYRQKYQFVFVDEYQDLNHGQYSIVQSLAPPEDPENNICVIGDPNQCIYGFRGSDKKYFERFTKDYPHTEKITLTQNYRSTEPILEASSQVIAKLDGENVTERVYSGISGLKTLNIIETPTEKAEAVGVGKIIENLLGGTGFHSIDFGKTDGENESRSFSDFAVLYRTTSQCQVFSEVFENAGIPFQVSSKQHFFGKPGIKELISLLRLVDGRASYTDMDRAIAISKCGVGKKSVEVLKNWGYANKFAAAQLVDNIRRLPVAGMTPAIQRKVNGFFGTIDRIKQEIQSLSIRKKIAYFIEHPLFSARFNALPEETVLKLLSFADGAEATTSRFLNEIDLKTDTDLYEPIAEKVSLMSLHAAKGLEFPIVFITGCENGFIPFKKTDDTPTNMDEERRLFYVAMTRAKECIYITYSKKRKLYGRVENRAVSPFVNDIEKHLKTLEAMTPTVKKKEKQIQLDLFR
jgi:ATP-dependent DNA helicase UvrD/PcrA